MKYTKIGSSDMDVSKICLGCMSFGDNNTNFLDWTLDFNDSEAAIKHASDLGINFFDTANCYSGGTSEEYVGRVIKDNFKREDIFLATKVYFGSNRTTGVKKVGLSKEAINKEIDGSLERLQTDYVDLYIIHRFDYDTPIEETMEALHGLVKSGKVRNIGASAMYGYQFHNMQICAEQNGWTKFVTMQDHYNLLYREDERDLIPVCKQYDVALTPYSPLASGRLSRTAWHTDSKRSETDVTAVNKYDEYEQADRTIVMRVAELAKKYGVTMTQIALGWQFAKGVAAPIVGVSKLKYLDDAVGSLDVSLSKEDRQYLEESYIPHKITGAL